MSLSIIVPALNEEKNLSAAVSGAISIAQDFSPTWEIIIINDGSSDATGKIADKLAESDPRIRVIHHAKPKNLGGAYRAGVAAAKFEFVIMVPGDNENCPEGVRRVLALAGTADMIIPWPENSFVRPWQRRLLSSLFALLVRFLSGVSVRYFNGTVLHRTALVRDCSMKSSSFSYQAELILELLSRGCSYREVPITLSAKLEPASSALRWRNIRKVLSFLVTLLCKRIFFRPMIAISKERV